MNNIEFLDPQKLDGDAVDALWQKASQVNEAFDDRTRNHPEFFVASMFNGTQWVKMGDKGLASVENIMPGASATVHVLFWDKSEPHTLVSMVKETLDQVFKIYGLVRVSSFFGDFNQDAIRLTQLLGFKEEGRLRKGVLYNNQFHDMILMGLLREDFLTEGG